MAFLAGLGALTDELVTIITSTSPTVSEAAVPASQGMFNKVKFLLT